MQKSILLSSVTGCVLGLTLSVAHADQDALPAGAVSVAKVLQNLQGKGFTAINEIEYDDGVYKVEAINAQGHELKFKIDAQTGKVPATKTVPTLTMADIAKKLAAEGYQIVKLKAGDKGYKAKAFDKNGERVELEIDAETGVIKHES